MTTSEDHMRRFLQSLDLDVEDEHLVDTARRVARFWQTWLAEGEEAFRFTTFAATNADDLVMTGNIRFYTMCAHHLVPFFGEAHIAYVPGTRLVGLSKLVRVVRMFACRPQVQERLTRQITEYLNERLQPRGIAVLLQAEHLCMSMRGVKAPGHITITECALGELNEPYWLRRFHDYIKIGEQTEWAK